MVSQAVYALALGGVALLITGIHALYLAEDFYEKSEDFIVGSALFLAAIYVANITEINIHIIVLVTTSVVIFAVALFMYRKMSKSKL